MRKWRNWQTRTFEGRVEHSIRVQVPSSAFSLGPRGPFVFLSPLSSLFFFSSFSRSPSAGFFYFVSALTLAGMGRPSRSFFSPARLADKRPPEPASCQSPLPEAKKERLLRLWTPPQPPRVQPHVWIGSVVQWGLNSVIQGLQGPFPDSQADCNMLRSTPRMQRNVSDLYSMKVHSENVRAGSNTYPLHLH